MVDNSQFLKTGDALESATGQVVSSISNSHDQRNIPEFVVDASRPGYIVLSCNMQACCQGDSIFHTLSTAISRRWKESMSSIANLYNAAPGGGPTRLWLSPHQFEVMETLLRCGFDHSVRNICPSWDLGCGLQDRFGVYQSRPRVGSIFFTLVVPSE